MNQTIAQRKALRKVARRDPPIEYAPFLIFLGVCALGIFFARLQGYL